MFYLIKDDNDFNILLGGGELSVESFFLLSFPRGGYRLGVEGSALLVPPESRPRTVLPTNFILSGNFTRTALLQCCSPPVIRVYFWVFRSKPVDPSVRVARDGRESIGKYVAHGGCRGRSTARCQPS